MVIDGKDGKGHEKQSTVRKELIASFGSAIRRATLFFTPTDRMRYEETVVDEEDTTLFVKGRAFEIIGDDKFMFQVIAHA